MAWPGTAATLGTRETVSLLVLVICLRWMSRLRGIPSGDERA